MSALPAGKLKPGDEVRVVSPAISLGVIPGDQKEIACEHLAGLGLKVSYSKNSEFLDRFDSSPVEARVSDLHDAFSDPDVKGILTTLGGYNSNQLLGRLDYGLIQANPKVFCGYSDITALATLTTIFENKPELSGIPVVANASFGHTTPQFTFPLGGRGLLHAERNSVRFGVESH